MDALTKSGDEGRGVTAISFGEVCSNLRSGDFRMGKPCLVNRDNFLRKQREQTLGSETSQYQEEKKKIFIFLVAASEKERAQTSVAIQGGCKMTI